MLLSSCNQDDYTYKNKREAYVSVMNQQSIVTHHLADLHLTKTHP